MSLFVASEIRRIGRARLVLENAFGVKRQPDGTYIALTKASAWGGRDRESDSPFHRNKAIKVGGQIHEAKPGQDHQDLHFEHGDKGGTPTFGYIGHDSHFYSQEHMGAATAHHIQESGGHPHRNEKVVFSHKTLRRAAATVLANRVRSIDASSKKRAEGTAKFKEMMRSAAADLANEYEWFAKAIAPERTLVLAKSAKEEEGQHFYHATHEYNAHDIAHDKLRTHSPSFGTDQHAWPDGKTERRSYFNANKAAVSYFHPEGGKPAVLRVHSSNAKFQRESGTGDHYVRHAIDPKHIQIETHEGFKPLHEWAGVTKSHEIIRTQTIRGIPISIENDEGDKRHWKDPGSGKTGWTKMKFPYGYIRRTKGMDGEEVDCFVGNHPEAQQVYIILQMKAPDFKVPDEEKCFIGFKSAGKAVKAYLEHYDNHRYFGGLRSVPVAQFKAAAFQTKKEPGPIAAPEKPYYEIPGITAEP